jgi:hypothetical protein
VAVSDFNQDSRLDVVAVTNNGTVVVLLGQGNGRLYSPLVYTTGSITGWVSTPFAFDANGDGKLDLVVTNAGSTSVAVLFGDGQGHLSTPTLYSTSSAPSVIRVFDVNQDSYPDLLLLNGPSCYTLLTGQSIYPRHSILKLII